ncbi:DUF1127 domain-containing protein [Rhodovulum sp. YNF3179]|uniref:DUF1127 domain-containing protein n=1 Tax=Rhodovulum sp. YNF3179 TaxID=3425127 RepID=UPI003D333AB8
MALVQAHGGMRDGLGARIAAIAAGMREAYARYRIYRKTKAELHALDARELTDLGIVARDIPALARDAARRAQI